MRLFPGREKLPEGRFHEKLLVLGCALQIGDLTAIIGPYHHKFPIPATHAHTLAYQWNVHDLSNR